MEKSPWSQLACLHSNTQQLACSVVNSRQKFPASQWKNLVRSTHTDTKFLIVSVNLFTSFRCNTIIHKINKIKYFHFTNLRALIRGINRITKHRRIRTKSEQNIYVFRLKEWVKFKKYNFLEQFGLIPLLMVCREGFLLLPCNN